MTAIDYSALAERARLAAIIAPNGAFLRELSEGIARLIAERDATAIDRDTYKQGMAHVIIERDALQEQVNVLRDALEIAASCRPMGHETLTTAREHKIREALAATEPKEADNIHRNEVDHDVRDRPEMPDY